MEKYHAQHKYYKNNKKNILEYHKQYVKDNCDKLKEYRKEYYKKNRKKMDEYKKRYNKDHYIKNKSKILKYQKIYREEHSKTKYPRILLSPEESKERNRANHLKAQKAYNLRNKNKPKTKINNLIRQLFAKTIKGRKS